MEPTRTDWVIGDLDPLQAALVASWFRNAHNRPANPPQALDRHTAAGQPPKGNTS